jgi:hypothetical protein
MIDWDWPIEFLDGTPAWTDDDGLVLCAEKPFGVPVAKCGRLFSMLPEGNESRLRNVDMPEIRFVKWHAKPVAGTFVTSTMMNLKLNAGDRGWDYSWPGLKPLGDAPEIQTMNRKQLAVEEENLKEQAALEESDIYGLF